MLYVQDMIYEISEHPLTGQHYRHAIRLLRELMYVARAQAAYARNVYPAHAKENEWLAVHRDAMKAFKQLTGEDPPDDVNFMSFINLTPRPPKGE